MSYLGNHQGGYWAILGPHGRAGLRDLYIKIMMSNVRSTLWIGLIGSAKLPLFDR